MKFSIVIPTCNRSQSLADTLESLSKTYRSKSQIVVIVADNSTKQAHAAATQSVVKNAARWFNTTYIFSKRGGPSIARNLGIARSRHNHIIFIDDDTLVPRAFIRSYERLWLKHTHAAMIGGKVIPRFQGEKTGFVKKEFEWIYAHKDLGNTTCEVAYPEFIFSANMSVCFTKKTPLFNERLGRRYPLGYCIFGEDIELCYRYQKENKIIIYNPDIRVVNNVKHDRMLKEYYWKRIINGGIERRVIDSEHHIHSGSSKSPGLNITSMVWYATHNHQIFWERIAYYLGYYVLGNLLIITR